MRIRRSKASFGLARPIVSPPASLARVWPPSARGTPNYTSTFLPIPAPQREVDIFVGTSLPIEGRIISRKLTDYHAGLFASQGYLRGRPPIGSVSDVVSDGYVCICGVDDMFALVPRPQFRSANILPLLQAVKDGEAIAVLPSYVAHQNDDLVPVLSAHINFRRSLYVLLHEDNKNLTRVRTVSDFIFGEVQKNRSIFLSEQAFDPSERGVADELTANSSPV
jgi:DNA-binding transcriptional LysR family regulator